MDIAKKAKMEAFFRQHVLDNIEASLHVNEGDVLHAVDFVVKVGQLDKTAAANLLNSDRKQASKLVDILKDLEKYKDRIESGEDDESKPDDEEKTEFYQQHDYSGIENHPLGRDVSSPLPHSTFNVPEGQMTHSVGPAG